MRTDHFAYQRATKVAGVGLLMQIVIGIGLLVFGMLSSPRDLPLIYAALYVLPGVLVWLGLVIVYHQHKLERLESLEEDELAAAGSVQVGVRPVSRGIARGGAATWSHAQVVPPGLSLAAFEWRCWRLLTWRMIMHMRGLTGRTARTLRSPISAAGRSPSACSWLLSPSSSRLRGGHGRQEGVGESARRGGLHRGQCARVLVAIAIGIIFRFLENENVIYVVTWGIPILMGLLAAEVTLNFILNLYRPRIPGEVQRPAFDSRD